MKLALQKIDPLPIGIYGPNADLFPERMAYLHPDAAEAFARLQADTGGHLIYSDMWRSAKGSLSAHSSKAGVQPPGYSAHNYGLAFDLDVDRSLRSLGCTYDFLLDRLASYGWYCHRRDRQQGSESWHFNFLGALAGPILGHTDPVHHGTWAQAAELAIECRYPEITERMEPTQIQQCLAELGLYGGAIDGKLGPLSTAAAQEFGQEWNVPQSGPALERTLRFVSAKLELFSVAQPPAVGTV